MNNHKGFTLIEFIFAVFIILVVISLIFGDPPKDNQVKKETTTETKPDQPHVDSVLPPIYEAAKDEDGLNPGQKIYTIHYIYQDHSYIIFWVSDAPGFSSVHDPNCPCMKEESQSKSNDQPISNPDDWDDWKKKEIIEDDWRHKLN